MGRALGRGGCALVFLGLILSMGFCVANLPKAPPSQEDEEENPFADVSKQRLWIVQSHETIRGRMRDPGSAEFRNSRFYSGSGTAVTCGEVNAKNAFGGYTGYERFIAAGPLPDLAFVASDFGAGESINDVWEQLCVRGEGDDAYVP